MELFEKYYTESPKEGGHLYTICTKKENDIEEYRIEHEDGRALGTFGLWYNDFGNAVTIAYKIFTTDTVYSDYIKKLARQIATGQRAFV